MSDLIYLFHIALQKYHGDCNKGESVPKTSNSNHYKDLEHNLTQHMIGILSALLPIYKYHI